MRETNYSFLKRAYSYLNSSKVVLISEHVPAQTSLKLNVQNHRSLASKINLITKF